MAARESAVESPVAWPSPDRRIDECTTAIAGGGLVEVQPHGLGSQEEVLLRPWGAEKCCHQRPPDQPSGPSVGPHTQEKQLWPDKCSKESGSWTPTASCKTHPRVPFLRGVWVAPHPTPTDLNMWARVEGAGRSQPQREVQNGWARADWSVGGGQLCSQHSPASPGSCPTRTQDSPGGRNCMKPPQGTGRGEGGQEPQFHYRRFPALPEILNLESG